jgi:hypothetical protein
VQAPAHFDDVGAQGRVGAHPDLDRYLSRQVVEQK